MVRDDHDTIFEARKAVWNSRFGVDLMSRKYFEPEVEGLEPFVEHVRNDFVRLLDLLCENAATLQCELVHLGAEIRIKGRLAATPQVILVLDCLQDKAEYVCVEEVRVHLVELSIVKNSRRLTTDNDDNGD